MTRPIDNDPAFRGGDKSFNAKYAQGLWDPFSGGTELSEDMFLSQQEGLTRLGSFLQSGDFSQMRPFMLDPMHAKGAARDDISFYMYKVGRKSHWLDFPKGFTSYSKIYAIPQWSREKGNTPYYWLDFYTVLPTQKLNYLSADSCRLKPGDPVNEIDFRSWHNFGEQLLVDFLRGRNGISFDDLIVFDVDVKKKVSFGMYPLATDNDFVLHLGNNPSFQDGDRLRFTPRRDDQGFYQWEEVVKVVPDVSEKEFPHVVTYRLFPEEHALRAQRNFSPEKQLVTDYMSGVSGIDFVNLRPIPFTLLSGRKGAELGVVRGKQVFFYLSTGAFLPNEEGVLLSKQDDYRRHQWLELYKVDPETKAVVGECLEEGEIINGNIEQKKWPGIKRALLADFANGRVGYEALSPIPVKKPKGNVIPLWQEGQRPVYIILSRTLDLKEGEDLLFIPGEQSSNYTDFMLTKGGGVSLQRHRLDMASQTFRLEEVFPVVGKEEVSGEGAIDAAMSAMLKELEGER